MLLLLLLDLPESFSTVPSAAVPPADAARVAKRPMVCVCYGRWRMGQLRLCPLMPLIIILPRLSISPRSCLGVSLSRHAVFSCGLAVFCFIFVVDRNHNGRIRPLITHRWPCFAIILSALGRVE